MLPCMNALGRAAEGCAEPRERTGSGIFEGAFVRQKGVPPLCCLLIAGNITRSRGTMMARGRRHGEGVHQQKACDGGVVHLLGRDGDPGGGAGAGRPLDGRGRACDERPCRGRFRDGSGRACSRRARGGPGGGFSIRSRPPCIVRGSGSGVLRRRGGRGLPNLPGSLLARDDAGGQVAVEGVSWECADADPVAPGTHVFAAVLPAGYEVAPSARLPQVTVNVAAPQAPAPELVAAAPRGPLPVRSGTGRRGCSMSPSTTAVKCRTPSTRRSRARTRAT